VRILLIVLVVALGAIAVAVGLAWGWSALAIYAGVLAFSGVLGAMVALMNRSGGEVAREFGRRRYDQLMGNRR
jgi:hypothetical protein